MRVFDRLAEMKGQFGPQASSRTVSLLGLAANTRLREPAEIIRFHEIALYLRAYPQSPEVLSLASEILFTFHERVTQAEDFESPEISGIAGTGLSTNFSHEVVKRLLPRYAASISIDWDNLEHPERLAPALARLIPESKDDWAVEAHADYRGWFEKGQGTVAWLVENLSADVYDLIELPVRWELGESSATRTRCRIPGDEIFYHDAPFLRRSDISLTNEFAAPPIVANKLGKQAAHEILAVILDTSSVRYRELYGFTYPDAASVHHVDLGRGVDFFFFGVPRARRLPIREYQGGMFFKNGVPIGYVETLTHDGTMEVGFNLYYTFRDGETAWLYARLLKLFRERFRPQSFSIDPYQIGHENQEAIDSGAFWFYRKLGFTPSSREAEALTTREEYKMKTHPGLRSSPATLRKLSVSALILPSGL